MRKKAVFVDIDNTLIHGITIKIIGAFLFKKGIIGLDAIGNILFYFILYKLNLIDDMERILKKMFHATQNWKAEPMNQLARECFGLHVKPKIYSSIVNRLQKFHGEGYEIYYVSSTISIMGQLFEEEIGFGKAITTITEIKNGSYTGKTIGLVCYGIEKINRIKKELSLDNYDLLESYALSDHPSDLPLLEFVGHPIVVNPKRKLRKLAEKRAWEICWATVTPKL